MQPRWHEPAKTPQGELLTLVKQMEKALEKPQLADRDKDGKLSGWEKAVGKKIESSKKGKETGEYKSDRGNKKIPFKEGVYQLLDLNQTQHESVYLHKQLRLGQIKKALHS